MDDVRLWANHSIACNKSDCTFLRECKLGNRFAIGAIPTREPIIDHTFKLNNDGTIKSIAFTCRWYLKKLKGAKNGND